jgi:hypothetical protein
MLVFLGALPENLKKRSSKLVKTVAQFALRFGSAFTNSLHQIYRLSSTIFYLTLMQTQLYLGEKYRLRPKTGNMIFITCANGNLDLIYGQVFRSSLKPSGSLN